MDPLTAGTNGTGKRTSPFGFVVLGFAVLILAACASVAVVVLSAPANGLRQSIAAGLITQFIGKPVAVEGMVQVFPGRQTTVVVNGIKSTEPAKPGDVEERAERLSFSFPLLSAIDGRIDVQSVALDGARIVTGGGAGEAGSFSLARLLMNVLGGPGLSDVVLSDVALVQRGGAHGKTAIDALRLEEGAGDASRSIKGHGVLNGLPARLEGAIGGGSGAEGPQKRHLDLSATVAGTEIELTGALDTTRPVAAIDAKLVSRSSAYGDIPEAAGFARVIDGSGAISAQLSGPLDGLRVSAIKADLQSSEGTSIKVSGAIENINRGHGIDLHFGGQLSAIEVPGNQNGAVLDVAFTGFQGELGGTADALLIDKLILHTNIASAEFEDIGPVSIESVTRDEHGRLGFYGVRILNGPVDAPTLDLSGHVEDVLLFSGVSFDGTIDVPMSDLLDVGVRAEATALGRLKGELAVSDADGSLGLDRLEASVADSDILTLKLWHSIGDIPDLDDFALRLDLTIPHFESVVALLDLNSSLDGEVSYAGEVFFSKHAARIDGNAKIGRTRLTADLDGVSLNRRAVITGSIESDAFFMRDIDELLALIDLSVNDDDADLIDDDIDGIDIADNVRADITLRVGKVEANGTSVGNISGRLRYADDALNLDPFQFTYLGGRINAAASVDLGPEPPKTAISGTISNLPLRPFVRDLGAAPPISGSLTADFSVSGRGLDADSFNRTMTGRVNASLGKGAIVTNLIDLAGLNLINWLTSGPRGSQVELVCARMPFSFQNGRGTTNGLVLETQNVLVSGQGFADLGTDRIGIRFQPYPKRRQIVNIVTPFEITGTLHNPQIRVRQNTAGRAAAELLTLPLNVFGMLIPGRDTANADRLPCTLPKQPTSRPRNPEPRYEQDR